MKLTCDTNVRKTYCGVCNEDLDPSIMESVNKELFNSYADVMVQLLNG